MARTALETVALFLAPFAAYAVYLALRARFPRSFAAWSGARLSWLTLAGLAAAAGGLLTLEALAPRGHGRYVPAHLEHGEIVPGRFE